jgi:hypothetical protein
MVILRGGWGYGGKQAIWPLDDFVGSFHLIFLLLDGHVGLLISIAINGI